MKKRIAVIGDSHSAFFGGGEGIQGLLPLPEGNKDPILFDVGSSENLICNFEVFHLGPSLAYHTDVHGTKVKALEKVEALLGQGLIEEGQPILCSFGEIDCRSHILRQAAKQEKSAKTVVGDVLRHYLTFLRFLHEEHPVYVWGPIPSQVDGLPDNPDYPFYGNEVERNVVTEMFNQMLKDECEALSIKYLSIFSSLVDDNGKTRVEYIADTVHLSQRAWKFAVDAFRSVGIDVRFSGEWAKRQIEREMQQSPKN